jgi:hypothetical protein
VSQPPAPAPHQRAPSLGLVPRELMGPAGSGDTPSPTHLRGDDAPSGFVDEPDEPRAREDGRGHEERGGNEVVRMAGGCESLSAARHEVGWVGMAGVIVLMLTVEDYQSEG